MWCHWHDDITFMWCNCIMIEHRIFPTGQLANIGEQKRGGNPSTPIWGLASLLPDYNDLVINDLPKCPIVNILAQVLKTEACVFLYWVNPAHIGSSSFSTALKSSKHYYFSNEPCKWKEGYIRWHNYITSMLKAPLSISGVFNQKLVSCS